MSANNQTIVINTSNPSISVDVNKIPTTFISAGIQGPPGIIGATGPQGIQGIIGATGIQGSTGPQGGVINQLPSDWNQSITTAVDYIKNKPTIPIGAIVGTTDIQSLTNKTLTSPTIDGNSSIFIDSTDASDSITAPVTFSGGVGIAKKLYVGDDLYIGGDFHVGGTTITTTTSTLSVEDPMIYLASNSTGNTVDIGIIGHFDNGLYQHTGLVRKAIDNTWYLFSGMTTEPSSTVALSDPTFTIDTLRANIIGSIGATTANTIVGTTVTANTYFSGPGTELSGTAESLNIGGNSGTTTRLASAVNINGVAFDGSTSITINAVDSIDRVASSLLGANNGVATLNSSGKLTTSQIPDALVGALQYQGTWDANTNTPTLVSSTGIKGQYYKVSVAGTTLIDGLSSWGLGDSIVFDGIVWDKIDGQAVEVISVAGKTGAVILTSSDVGLGNVLNVAQLPATQSFSLTGDILAASSLLSSGTITTTLATIAQSTGSSFVKISLDTKGRVIGNTAVAQADITGLLGSGSITDSMLSNTSVASLSGSNTGDETATTIKTKLGITTLSGSNTGDQTITLTGDVTGSGTGSFATTLATITQSTGSSFVKISLDTKGRVIGNTAVAQADITGLLGSGSITDSMLSNTSGVVKSSTYTYPTIRPTLDLDFINSRQVDPRITFTRSTTATYYDGQTSVMAEQNLLLYSQLFSNAAWVATNVLLTANITAPDTTATAFTMAATAANATVYQSITTTATLYTFSIYIQAVTVTGSINLTLDGTTLTPQSTTTSWARYNISATPTAAAHTIGVHIANSGDSINIWGAQLENR